MRAPRVLLALAVGAGFGVGGGVLAHRLIPESPLVRGLFIGGQAPPSARAAPAWLARRADELRERAVILKVDGERFETTLDAIGVTVDVAATRRAAEVVGHEGTIYRRLREAREARDGKIDVPLVWAVDRGRLEAKLAEIAAQVAREPVDARLDLSIPAKVPDAPGRALDVPASMEQVERATHDDHEQVALIAREIPARIREADLVAVDVSRAVATFETTFSLIGTGAGRAVNIRRAASKIDGLVLAPGQVLSFNDVVGPRSIENGFTLAPEIQGDELQTGVGGGTCQVSSTLHAASLFATLEIVDRQSHSRLSSYTKPGLDATVSYPTTDLKIRNTLSFPVMIHAWLPKPTSVRVDLLGGDPVAAVEYAYGMGHAEDFVRRVYVKPELPPGKRIKRQKGARGYGVTSIVTMRFPGGRVEERRYFSGYRPSPEVFWVSPGYDEREMPPLPEHAKGIEQRGAHREEGDFYAM